MQVAAIIFALVLSILVCLAVAWLVGRNLSIPGAKPLFVAVIAELWWLVMYLGELLSGTEALTIAFARLQWVGVVVIPVTWTIFVIEYLVVGSISPDRVSPASRSFPAWPQSGRPWHSTGTFGVK